MPDENQGNQKLPDGQTEATPQHAASSNGRYSTVKLLVLIAILAVALFAVYRFGVLNRFAGSFGIPRSATELPPSLNRLSPDNSISSVQLLADLGRSPVDPSKVLFPAFEKSVVSDPDKKPASCPPGSIASPTAPTGTEEGSLSQQAAGPTPPGASRAGVGKTVETPVIVSRGPSDSTATGKAGRKKKTREKQASEPKPQAGQDIAGSAEPGDASATSQTGQQAKVDDAAAKPKKPAAPAPHETKPPDSTDQTKREQFQLPGSLVVKVHNYSGTFAKWGLMVILDDSAAMGRKSKLWNPNKMATAAALVRRLQEAVTPGSKMAVRDFLCTKSESGRKGATTPCLSHMLYDWADHPFKGLKEKLDNIDPGGQTNVCAAAAYALKKDLAGLKDLAPRVLLVTSGSGKCAVKEVLRALEQRGGQGPATLDVISLAMAKKREGAYAALAKKGHGLFLKMEKPADLDQTLTRYGKALKTKVFERIEVKGEKAVFNTALEEELTLPPGSYTVILPVVAGLSPSKRIIPKVQINSGEAKVLEVQVKKGQPVVRTGKK